MFFWTSAAIQTAAKIESVRNAEKKLLSIAKTYTSRSPDSWEIRTLDTHISRSAVPLRPVPSTNKTVNDRTVVNGVQDDDDDDELVIHSVHVTSKLTRDDSSDVPLVMLHGYMNAGAYFYRNFGGLSHHFRSIYALDMLGWGLSSRPSFDQVIDSGSIQSAEDFFVESLEAWRSKNHIERMVLAGHSFGGYMSVAYCERYPERVERLLLLSPVGVPDEHDPNVQARYERMRSSWRGRTFLGIFQSLFGMTTPGGILRTLSEERSYNMAQNYVQRRLPEISDAEESKTVADYLYYNAVLPGSGEKFLHSVLTSKILAKKPLLSRIPNLHVQSITFLYGSTDWMDISGGLNTQRLCERLNEEHSGSSPQVRVYLVPKAGHLLMLQNPEGTNAGIIQAIGGKPPIEDLPAVIEPGSEELHEAWLEETLKARQERLGSRLSRSEMGTV